ncbi:MAG: response regulator transcription factor [Ferruginibacter sp.]|nr:response regulator transcription factor [Ferruginibacter sp.]
MIKALLIDDEPNNTTYVNELLKTHFTSIQVLAISNDSNEGLLLIDELQPQLVFLDVEMPGLTGFDILKKLEPINFEVIFITAYNHYAVDAFENNAIGYLTKPLQVEKFIKATNTAISKIEKENINQHLFSLLQNNAAKTSNNKIALSTQNGLLFILPEDILYCQSSGNYTKFFTKDGKHILVSRQLGEFEKLLSAEDFHRIHDQYIVRLQYIKEYIRGRGGELIMENNDSLPVSANRKDAFLQRFEKWMKKM